MLSVPASANQTTFNFASGTGAQAGSTGNAYGDSLSVGGVGGVGGISVTETAWYVPNGSTTLGAAAVDNYSGATLGLGICSPNDPGGVGCGSPNHQVDNAVGDEFILFKFTGGTVSLGANSSITVANYAPDPDVVGGSTAVDLTYYSAATAISVGTHLSSEGTGVTVYGDAGSGTPVTYSGLSESATSVTYLLVGAAVGEITDAFKINQLVVNDGLGTVTSTPEPATFGLIGVALAGLGIASRKRKANRS
jgi:hypothetical protein